MSPQSPDSTANPPIEDKALSVGDAIEFLSAEDTEEQETLELEKDTKKTAKEADKGDKDETDKDDEGKEKPGKSIEDELEEELNEDLETPDKEELELITPVRRKEILAKYPNLFKDFPYLQKAYYLEQQYSEILPTIEDAKQAVEKAELLDTYEKEIMNGSTESLLTAVKDGDKEAFAKVVDNYLPTLFKVDEGAYYHTIGNIIKHTIVSMVRDGKESNTEELINAADVVNQYIFGTKNFTPPSRMSKDEVKSEDKQKESELSEREKKFVEQQFDTAQSTITTKIDNILKSTIDKNIDPNQSMTDYVRRNAVREVNETLENLIDKDVRFRAIYDKLWERAFEDNFSTVSMDRIKSAYLSKAKTLLPALIKKARNEALKGLGKRVHDDDNDEKDRKGPLPVGKTRTTASSPNRGKTGDSKQIPKGMTTLEFLNSD